MPAALALGALVCFSSLGYVAWCNEPDLSESPQVKAVQPNGTCRTLASLSLCIYIRSIYLYANAPPPSLVPPFLGSSFCLHLSSPPEFWLRLTTRSLHAHEFDTAQPRTCWYCCNVSDPIPNRNLPPPPTPPPAGWGDLQYKLSPTCTCLCSAPDSLPFPSLPWWLILI